MCHLCRKIRRLECLNNKAAKPIFLLLSVLHKHVSPHLGDIWLWRLSETTRLKKLLESIYKTVPVASLKAILKEIDDELEHIKKSMVDHPAKRSTGKWSSLRIEITPSESPTSRVTKVIELEAGKKLSVSEVEERIGECVLGRVTKEERELWKTMPEVPGSDPDPPENRIDWSIQYVKEWMKKCDAAVGAREWRETDSMSMVSLIGGVIAERPALDVGIWKRITTRSMKGRSRAGSYNYKSKKSRMKPINQISNCILDKPSKMLELDMRLVGEVVEVAATRSAKEKHKKNLTTLFLMKKAEKLSKSKRISVDGAIRILKAKKKGAERKLTMSGGRSGGGSPRAASEICNTNFGQSCSSFSCGQESVSLTRSEVERCVKKAISCVEVSKVDGLELEYSSSGYESSRDSVINMGSIIGRPGYRGGSASSNDSFRPSTPMPIGKGRSTIPLRTTVVATTPRRDSGQAIPEVSKILIQEIPSRREGRREERKMSFTDHIKDREGASRAKLDVTVSPTVLTSRRRRAERNASAPLMDRYKNEERQRLWKE